MNKKILKSFLTIGIVLAVVGGATRAIFTDKETSTGNTFSAGTIDISVDDQNPWTDNFALTDMKPCYTDYINFTIKNVGSNPADIVKRIEKVVTDEGIWSEPECKMQRGTWNEGTKECSGADSRHGIDRVIDYDLSVVVKDETGEKIWWQTIYDEDVTIRQIKNTDMYLGMLPVGWTMEVTQSYHMQEDTGNWAQGDKMTFDITLNAKQLTGSVVLENKTGDPDWDIIQDGIEGTLTYEMMSPTFDYTFEATGLAVSDDYSLIYYADPWAGDNPGALIATFTTDGSGNIALTPGSVNLGTDLPNSVDANYPGGAKIWLVLSSDYNNGSASTGPMTSWNPGSYLFETGLIEYHDTDH